MVDTGLPESGIQTAHPRELSGQLLLKGDELTKVPIFILPKHPDKPVWSMGYPVSCYFANILSMSEMLYNPAHNLETEAQGNYTAKCDWQAV